MSRQDYKRLAAIFCQLERDGKITPSVHAQIVKKVGQVLSDENPRFDWEKWENTCKGQGVPSKRRHPVAA